MGAAERAWASATPYWGVWSIPDSEVKLLPTDLSGQRCIELGCGTAYVSAWMSRRGGQVVGIDPTPNQLATAQRMQAQHNLVLDLIEGFAESLPFATNSFDFAISEYGAALWSDPYLWVPEASRVLKPGGQLVFITNSPLAVMCSPEDETETLQASLLRPYFGMHAQYWPDAPGQTEFHLTHGHWIELLTKHGFVIERLVELQALQDSVSRYPWTSLSWSRQWPTEDAWVVRKTQ